MKRTIVFAILCLSLLPVLAQADSMDDMIKASEQQLQQKLQKRDDMSKQWAGFEQKKSDILFAYNAAVKQEDVLNGEIDQWKQKTAALGAQYDALKPELDSYNAAVASHNAHQCTEKCTTNGGCDGSCAWYTAEKNQLDARQAALTAKYAPLDAQQNELKGEQAQLQKNSDLLQQIKQNVTNDTEAWVAGVKQFKSDWDDNEAQITMLQNNIARLKELKGKVDDCMRAIPPECDRPDAIGPDGKPILNGKCETMKAQCSAIFDGNRPQ